MENIQREIFGRKSFFGFACGKCYLHKREIDKWAPHRILGGEEKDKGEEEEERMNSDTLTR